MAELSVLSLEKKKKKRIQVVTIDQLNKAKELSLASAVRENT